MVHTVAVRRVLEDEHEVLRVQGSNYPSLITTEVMVVTAGTKPTFLRAQMTRKINMEVLFLTFRHLRGPHCGADQSCRVIPRQDQHGHHTDLGSYEDFYEVGCLLQDQASPL